MGKANKGKIFFISIPFLFLLFFLLIGIKISNHFSTKAYAGDGTISGPPYKLNLNVYYTYSPTSFHLDYARDKFIEASQILYNSTEGQLQLGNIYVYTCRLAKNMADIWITDNDSGPGSNSTFGGLGRRGYHITLNPPEMYTEPCPGGLTIVHELGHYLFYLKDEYKKILVDADGNPIEPYDVRSPGGACTGNPSDPASIMEASSTVLSHRTEWCTPSEYLLWNTKHNDEIETDIDGNRWLNLQEALYQESCWETIARKVLEDYGIILNIPTSQPSTELPAGHQDIVWQRIFMNCRVRVVDCIDRSGSMMGDKIDLAKLGAQIFTFLTDYGDFLGVTSYASDTSVDYPIQEVTDTTHFDAQMAINDITAGGLTSIGGGLRTSMEEITSLTPRNYGNEYIVLLSDGHQNTGEAPSEVLPDIISEQIKVFTIGIGDGADVVLLQDIASQTGGEFYFPSSASDLPEIKSTILAKIYGDDVLDETSGSITAGSPPETKSILIDEFNDKVTIILRWGGSDLDLILVRPDGTQIDPSTAASDPNIDYVEQDVFEFYRIQSPMAGEWQAIVEAVDVQGQEDFVIQTLSSTAAVSFTVGTDKDTYVYPENIRVEALVVAGSYVADAEVYGQVVTPDGPTVDITLYDDGKARHGDKFANDGIYSNFFSDYSGNGVYTFELVVDNQNGVEAYSPIVVDDFTGTWTPQSIPPFTRRNETAVIVSGVPGIVPAIVDIDPETLNIKSKGKYITAYIELLEAYDVNDIQVESIVLMDEHIVVANALQGPSEIADHDSDSNPDLMVKFDRKQVIDYLKAEGKTSAIVEFRVEGTLSSGEIFKGKNSVRVISPGK